MSLVTVKLKAVSIRSTLVLMGCLTGIFYSPGVLSWLNLHIKR